MTEKKQPDLFEEPILPTQWKDQTDAEADEFWKVLKEKNENVFKPVRTMPSGATRSSEQSKFAYEGFINPAVLAVFANYMHMHRMQKDGTLREADNWQKGIGKQSCMESGLRHMMDLWALHRGYSVWKEKTSTGGEKTHYVLPWTELQGDWREIHLYDALCGIMFNTQAYILEQIKEDGGAYAD
jgi:hypothetical protein